MVYPSRSVSHKNVSSLVSIKTSTKSGNINRKILCLFVYLNFAL